MEGPNYLVRTRILVWSLVVVLTCLALLMLAVLTVHPDPRLAINTAGIVVIIALLTAYANRWKSLTFVMTIVTALFVWAFSMAS